MPYRLDTFYDAMASLAVTSDASTNRRSVATPTPHPASTSAGWSADPKEVAGACTLQPALHAHRLREGTDNPPWCGSGRSVKLLDPPANEPNTRVREAYLIGHRSGDVQVAPVDVRPAVDHRDVVRTPSCVAHRKLGAKRQGTVRHTPRRGRHHLPRGRVGSRY